MNYRIDSFSGILTDFKPFIEKGFKWGYHSSKETVPLETTNYPYQLSFNSRPRQEITITIREDQLEKFDSSNAVWGYLKQPVLPDTVILEIRGENIQSGIIKVW